MTADKATVLRRLARYHAEREDVGVDIFCTCGECLCSLPLRRPHEIRHGRCSECQQSRHEPARDETPDQGRGPEGET